MAPLTAELVLNVPHFSSLSAGEAAQFAPELIVRTFQPRELIAVEGEPCRGLYQMLSGRARLFRTGTDGREQIMLLLHPGDTFAEVAVFDDGPIPASIEALDESEVLLVPTAVCRRIATENPAVALAVLEHFARRLRAFTELVQQVALQTVQQRLARYLYVTAREEGRETPEGIFIARSITVTDLAALVGSVREVVSRTLHLMETDGVVEVRRKEILVRDLVALRQLL